MLRASGRRIVNEGGQTVRLRGVNLGGWLVKEGYMIHFPGPEVDAPSEIDRAIVDLAGPDAGPALLEEWREQWIAEADLAEIRALGFNSVRLPLHFGPLWDVGAGTPREEGLASLDRDLPLQAVRHAHGVGRRLADLRVEDVTRRHALPGRCRGVVDGGRGFGDERSGRRARLARHPERIPGERAVLRSPCLTSRGRRPSGGRPCRR
jgi:hypothetical protein